MSKRLTVDTAMPAGDKRLLDFDVVVQRLKPTDDRIDDLSDLVDEISLIIGEEYFGYPLWRQQYTEFLQGTGMQTICLSRFPVEDPLLLVEFAGAAIDVADVRAEDPQIGQLYREAGFTRSQKYGGLIELEPIPGSRNNEFKFQYWAGYWTVCQDNPGGDSRPMPRLIQRAAWEAVRTMFAEPDAVRSSLQTYQIGRFKVDNRDTSATSDPVAALPVSDLPMRAIAMLDRAAV